MKAVITALTEVPDALQGEYEAKDGKFILKVEGDYPPLVESNAKLAEFRDNNRALNTKKVELETQLKQFEGINPAEHQTLKTKLADFEKGGIKKTDDIAERIKEAVAASTKPLEEKLLAREASEKAAQEALQRQGLENQLREVGMKVGVDDRAIRDYINRGLEVFKLIDGQPAPRRGENPIFSKQKPAEELSMEEWATDLQTEAPFLFKPSRGGGAGTTGNGSNFTGPKKVITADPAEFGRNLEAIAAGEVSVQD